MRRALAFACASLATHAASAQQLKIGAFVEGGSGVEIGGGKGFVLAHRARTTLTLGAMIGNSEWPREALLVAVSAEIEPNVSIGGMIAAAHALAPYLTVHAGLAGVIAPQSLFGPVVGARARLKLGALTLLVGPDVKGYVLGGDLPDSSVIVVGLLSVGLHANL